ncbi:MAG: iron ABC transporter permease [Bacteroidales bacterium]|nr:iron ABC transporter permease [Bacteroidales bacterium]
MKRKPLYFILFALLLVVFFAADLLLGSSSLSVKDLFSTEVGRDILLSFRLPKAIVAVICGIALATCGLQMQTLFRNPLADPYILGVSSGAGLGVALYIMGSTLWGGAERSALAVSLGSAGAALVGAFAVTMLILYISNRVKGNLTLLIFGVMIGFIASAIVNLLQYTSNAHSLKAYVLWTMGSFAALDKMQIAVLAVLVVVGLTIAIWNIKNLNAILPGEEYAASIGLNVRGIRNRILISTTLLAGAVTAFCGPIGFLGIAVPHIARFIFKDANHRVLFPASALLGGVLTLLADTLSELPGTGSIIPINTMAALLGIPVILVILFRKSK